MRLFALPICIWVERPLEAPLRKSLNPGLSVLISFWFRWAAHTQESSVAVNDIELSWSPRTIQWRRAFYAVSNELLLESVSIRDANVTYGILCELPVVALLEMKLDAIAVND
jgi:hypothetical protein